MVIRIFILFWICYIATLPRWSHAQNESGQSLMQLVCANSEAIRNYDVSFRHWVGYVPRNQKAKPENSYLEESVTTGRIVVDRSQERVLYVREYRLKVDEKATKETIYAEWRNGMEVYMSDQSPFPGTQVRTFDRFYKLRNVPVVERCMGKFPPGLTNRTIAEDLEMVVRRFEPSTMKMNPDGSSTVSLKVKDSNVVYSASFDPVSWMPTKCSLSEYSSSGEFLRVLESANPRYEKCKEIYRIISLEYDEQTSIWRDMPRHVIGTVQFDWHKFNEEQITFPSDSETFSFDDAKNLLRIHRDTRPE